MNLLRTLALFATFLIATSAVPAEEPPLVVGMELAYPPFEMTDTQGNPKGISVDLAKALAENLGRELEIRNIPFDGLIPALKSGKIDLILSSMTATPERARSIDFSDPYLKTGLCLLVGSDSGIRSIADVDKSSLKIAVKKGTTGHLYAAKNIKHAKVLVLDKETAGVLEVVQGKADAFVYDQMSTFKHWQSHRDSTRAILEPFQTETWAIGLRRGDDALRAQVNAFLAEFRKLGGFERLGDEYLSEQKRALAEEGIPFYF